MFLRYPFVSVTRQNAELFAPNYPLILDVQFSEQPLKQEEVLWI